MPIKISLIALFCLLTSATYAQKLEASFQIDYELNPIVGVFLDTQVDFKFEAEDLANSYFNAVIQVATINTEMKARDAYLMKKQYFHVDKFPTMTFNSKRVIKEGIRYYVEGELTIKDVTKTLKLPIDVSFNETGISMLKTEFVIDRRDYNVGKSHFVLEDDVTIRLRLKI